MLWLPGLPLGGAYSTLLDPLAEISNIFIQNNYKNDPRKAIPYLVINIISDCIKELFMHIIVLCRAYFSRANINKKLWPPLRFDYFECSGAGTFPYFECSGAGTA